MDKIEITVEVNGKQVPISDLSEETLCKIRNADAEQRIPVAQLCRWVKDNDRLVLTMTPSIIDAAKRGYKFILIDLEKGTVPSTFDDADGLKRTACYNDFQDLTPKD